MEKKFINPAINVHGEIRKPAFASFNRDVNFKNVSIIEAKMREKGYRIGEPIQVLKAEYALERGICTLMDINDNTIPTSECPEYFLVVDGHHRTYAVSQYNEWLNGQGKDPINIPAVEVVLINGETVTEYCNEINCTKKEWSKEDYLNGAASVYPCEVLLQKYNNLITSESNPKGFCLSTLNLIYCNGKGLTKKDLVLLCSGETQKGSHAKQNIIPAYNIEIGDKFIQLCKEKGFKDEEITKRYIIKEFNDHRNSKGVDFAFKVIENITTDDISMMTNNRGKLLEQNVINHFIVMEQRLEIAKTATKVPEQSETIG